MAFEEFKHKKSRGVLEPRVSISNAGFFILNSGCMKQQFKGFDYVVLFWDKQSRKIGIKPVRRGFKHGYKLNKNYGIGAFCGRSFFIHYRLQGLNPNGKKTKSYRTEWNSKEGLLEFSVG